MSRPGDPTGEHRHAQPESPLVSGPPALDRHDRVHQPGRAAPEPATAPAMATTTAPATATTATARARARTSGDAAWRALVAAASEPYRPSGRHAFHFARNKLGGDPVFRHVLERGLIAPRARILDLGSGQGLLASLLRAAGRTAHEGRWPAEWGAPPVDARVTGIELMAHDVARAETALGPDATFICGDMREAEFPPADVVVIFDALHYISAAEQEHVLERVRGALGPGGVLLMRVGDTAARRRFAFGQWVDRITMAVRGGGFGRLTGRPVAGWRDSLVRLGFSVDAYPMSGRPPFANLLLVGRIAPELAR
jgi:SAM-dependent methyltransferase